MRRKIFPFLLVCGTLLATSIAVGTYTIIRSVVLESARQQASLKVQYSTARLDAWLGGFKSDIAAIARTPPLRSSLYDDITLLVLKQS